MNDVNFSSNSTFQPTENINPNNCVTLAKTKANRTKLQNTQKFV